MIRQGHLAAFALRAAPKFALNDAGVLIVHRCAVQRVHLQHLFHRAGIADLRIFEGVDHNVSLNRCVLVKSDFFNVILLGDIHIDAVIAQHLIVGFFNRDTLEYKAMNTISQLLHPWRTTDHHATLDGSALDGCFSICVNQNVDVVFIRTLSLYGCLAAVGMVVDCLNNASPRYRAGRHRLQKHRRRQGERRRALQIRHFPFLPIIG